MENTMKFANERTLVVHFFKELLNEVKGGASYGYIVVRLKQILNETAWSKLGVIFFTPVLIESVSLVKMTYNLFLVVVGLSQRGCK